MVKQNKYLGNYITLVTVVVIAPMVLNYLGVDFSSNGEALHLKDFSGILISSEKLTDELFYALRGAFHHALLEWSSVVLAMTAALMAWLHFRISGDATAPIIGIALFTSGMMDAFHTLAATRLISGTVGNSDLISFTWVISRVFNAAILLVGVGYLLRVQSEKIRLSSTQLLTIAMLIGVLAYGIIVWAALSETLPRTQYPDSWVTRPFDLLPLLLYVPGAFLVWKLYVRKPDILKLFLFLSFIPACVLELHMAFGSSHLFDSHFNIAHLLKIFEYGLPFVGFILYFKEQHESALLLEGALDEAENRFKAIIESAPNAFVLVDSAGVIQLVNPSMLKMFEYEEHEIMGQPVELLLPDDKKHNHKSFRKGFMRAPEIRNMGVGRELYAVSKNGRKFDVEVALAPFELGGQTYVMTEVQDISVRKKLEQENLARASKLQESADKLQETNNQLERFAYICSHDLQEPVRTMQSFAELLQKRLDDKGWDEDPKITKYLHFIIDGSSRARELITDVLKFCRLDVDTESFQDLDLNIVCQELHDSINANLEEKNGHFIWQHETPLPVIYAISGQMRQLFLNLINNGLKFNRSEEPTVWLEVVDEGNQWLVTVSDNGIGIEPEERPMAFEVFKRLHKRSEFPGSGLGLAICKKIIDFHHGDIEIQESRHGGTKFVIHLPKEQPGI